MPFYIIKDDLTKMNCDAIVSAANHSLLNSGGVGAAILNAAGPSLAAECKALGGCGTSEVKITKGYNLPCKYVIHTVGPLYTDGRHGERELLSLCYTNALKLAKKYSIESIAFPLISSGGYGFPQDKALAIATRAIRTFLERNEITVYLVLYDRESYSVCKPLLKELEEYIDCHKSGFEPKPVSAGEILRRRRNANSYSLNLDYEDNPCSTEFKDITYMAEMPMCSISPPYERRICKSLSKPAPSLQDLISSKDESFALKLMRLIDLKDMSDTECYKKANVSKQTWWKILNDENYRPSKNTIIAFAISLQLTYEETQALLATAGFTLSNSFDFDIIIKFFLERKIYDIFKINETLFEFDQPCLGV